MLSFRDGQRVDLLSLKETVRTAGFDLKWMDLVLIGILVQASGSEQEEALAIQIANTGQQVFLAPGDSDTSRRNYVEVRRWAGDEEVRLRPRGRAHGHPDGSIGLSISTFAVVKKR